MNVRLCRHQFFCIFRRSCNCCCWLLINMTGSVAQGNFAALSLIPYGRRQRRHHGSGGAYPSCAALLLRSSSLGATRDLSRCSNTLSFMHFGPFSSIIKPHGTRRARIARTSSQPSSLASTAQFWTQYDQTSLNKKSKHPFLLAIWTIVIHHQASWHLPRPHSAH